MNRSAKFASSAVSTVYDRHIIVACAARNRSKLACSQLQRQRLFVSKCGTLTSPIQSKALTRITGSHSYENLTQCRRNFSVAHEKRIELDEQLKNVVLQANPEVHSSVRADFEIPQALDGPKKSLIQGIGIEGAKNTQLFKAKTNGTVDVEKLQKNPQELSTSSSSLWVAPSFESDLIVVLDMDECLIHAQFQQDRSWPSSTSSDKYRQYESDRPYNTSDSMDEDTNAERCESFRISLPDGDLVHVNKRPHLSSFLDQVCNTFETYIFTAAMPVYACPVLDTLDPKEKIQGRFYRDSCSLNPELGAYVKDLQTVLSNRSVHQQNQLNELRLKYTPHKNKK